MVAILILLYVLGAVPTYVLFDKTTEQSKFNKIWFSVFWPAVSVFYLIYLIVDFVKNKK